MNKIIRFLSSLISAVIGKPTDFSLEERIFNAVCFATIIENSIILPLNLLGKIGALSGTYITILGIACVTVIYYLSRFRKIKLIKTWLSVLMLEISWFWFTNAGIISQTPAFFVFPMMFSIILLRGKHRILMSLMVLVNALSLVYIEYAYPTLIFPYHNQAQGHLDISANLTVVLVFVRVAYQNSFRQF